MGNDVCCSQKLTPRERIKVMASRPAKIQTKQLPRLGEMSSTSQSPTYTRNQSPIYRTPLSLKKQLPFTSYINQRELNISSIRKISESRQDCCSQQKIIFNYLQRLSKEISAIKKETDHRLLEDFLDRNQNVKFDQKKFIQHANSCPVCYELYENLRNFEIEESLKTQLMSECKRKSLRDSLLEAGHEELVNGSQSECKYLTTMITPEEAKKSMKKFPNVNKCQSKRLRFRKTSNFEPEIKEARESQESISTKEV